MAGYHLCDDVSTWREKKVYHKVTANGQSHWGDVSELALPSVRFFRILAEF